MRKKRPVKHAPTNQTESVLKLPGHAGPTPSPTGEAKKADVAKSATTQPGTKGKAPDGFIAIRGIPVINPEEGKYKPRAIVARNLSRKQSRGLKALLEGLKREHLVLSSGRSVQCATDAVRWLLEEVDNNNE